MTRLTDAIARAGERLVEVSGNRIRFDAQRALARGDELALADPGLWSPNRHCRLVQCRDDWMAISLARDDDRDLVPAWTGAASDTDPWDAVIAAAARRSAAEMVAAGVYLHLPVALVGEASPLAAPSLIKGATPAGPVVDLSALWAGPYCGALIAEAGYPVIKIESPDRPDSTARHTPKLDARLNSAKTRRRMALDGADLLETIATARALITSGRPHALARLGLDETRLFALNPGLLWIAITAHGWRGDGAMRVGFGDDCAAAGGLVRWEESTPHFVGDALADPLTGLMGAMLALEALAEGRHGLLDVSLAGTAATFAGASA